MSGGPNFQTITGPAWVRSLRAARVRFAPEAVSVRVLGRVTCPVCQQPGKCEPQKTGGAFFAHGKGVKCWQPGRASA